MQPVVLAMNTSILMSSPQTSNSQSMDGWMDGMDRLVDGLMTN